MSTAVTPTQPSSFDQQSSNRPPRSSYQRRGGHSNGPNSRRTNGSSQQQQQQPVDDTEEIAKLRKKYGHHLDNLKALFSDWTDEDLLFALGDAGGDFELTVDRVSKGQAEQFSSVSHTKPSKRDSDAVAGGGSKGGVSHGWSGVPSGPATAGERKSFPASKTRGTAPIRGARGGRGGFRGTVGARGRGGAPQANGRAASKVNAESKPDEEASAAAPAAPAAPKGPSWADMASGKAKAAQNPATSAPEQALNLDGPDSKDWGDDPGLPQLNNDEPAEVSDSTPTTAPVAEASEQVAPEPAATTAAAPSTGNGAVNVKVPSTNPKTATRSWAQIASKPQPAPAPAPATAPAQTSVASESIPTGPAADRKPVNEVEESVAQANWNADEPVAAEQVQEHDKVSAEPEIAQEAPVEQNKVEEPVAPAVQEPAPAIESAAAPALPAPASALPPGLAASVSKPSLGRASPSQRNLQRAKQDAAVVMPGSPAKSAGIAGIGAGIAPESQQTTFGAVGALDRLGVKFGSFGLGADEEEEKEEPAPVAAAEPSQVPISPAKASVAPQATSSPAAPRTQAPPQPAFADRFSQASSQTQAPAQETATQTQPENSYSSQPQTQSYNSFGSGAFGSQNYGSFPQSQSQQPQAQQPTAAQTQTQTQTQPSQSSGFGQQAQSQQQQPYQQQQQATQQPQQDQSPYAAFSQFSQQGQQGQGQTQTASNGQQGQQGQSDYSGWNDQRLSSFYGGYDQNGSSSPFASRTEEKNSSQQPQAASSETSQPQQPQQAQPSVPAQQAQQTPAQQQQFAQGGMQPYAYYPQYYMPSQFQPYGQPVAAYGQYPMYGGQPQPQHQHQHAHHPSKPGTPASIASPYSQAVPQAMGADTYGAAGYATSPASVLSQQQYGSQGFGQRMQASLGGAAAATEASDYSKSIYGGAGVQGLGGFLPPSAQQAQAQPQSTPQTQSQSAASGTPHMSSQQQKPAQSLENQYRGYEAPKQVQQAPQGAPTGPSAGTGAPTQPRGPPSGTQTPQHQLQNQYQQQHHHQQHAQQYYQYGNQGYQNSASGYGNYPGYGRQGYWG